MGRRIEIELPYEDDLAVELTDVAKRRQQYDGRSLVELIEWLHNSPHSSDEEMTAVFKCTAALKQMHPSEDLVDCLYQAIVWARG